MKDLSMLICKKWAFYSITLFSTVILLSYQNCGKVKFDAKRNLAVVPQSCGTIEMTPPNGLATDTDVTFEVRVPNGITISDLTWTFTKGSNSTPFFTSTTNPVTRSFDHAGEGVGDYLATAIFMKNDGNACELAQSFQIISGDLCVDPSGISGPTVGFVGEVTSPFSVDVEDCFVGSVEWDMDGDGIPEFTNWDVRNPVTHVYPGPATYTVRARVTNTEDNSQITLTHTIQIRYPNCDNGAINPPTCEVCPPGNSLVNNQCIPNCTNGAINPPACTNCPASQTLVNGQCVPNCSNGATNPPSCNQCPQGQSLVNNQCVQNCTNGATNPPTCTTCPTGQTLVNGQCFANCTNGATNPPTCNQCPTGQVLVGNQCVAGCTNGATNPPTCNQCPTGQLLIGGQCTTPANCTVGDTVVAHGETRTFYDNSNLGCGQGQNRSCGSQARTCNNGVMSGSANFSAVRCMAISCPTPTCTNGATNPPTCTTCPSGQIMVNNQCVPPAGCNVGGVGMVHGESRTFYVTATPVCGQGCPSIVRTCNNGVPSGDPSYTSPTCTAAQCASCTMDGVTIPHGQSRHFFTSSSVSCPATCASSPRTCDNGSWTGNTAYNRASCTAAACTYSWAIGNWSACSTTACGTTGTQGRTVDCKRSDGADVDDSFCGAKPPTTQSCSNPPCAAAGCWTCMGADSECSPGPAAGCGYQGYVTAHGVQDLRGTACATQGTHQTFKRTIPSSVVCDTGWLSCEACAPTPPPPMGSCPEECAEYERNGLCTSVPVQGGCSVFCSGSGQIYYRCK